MIGLSILGTVQTIAAVSESTDAEHASILSTLAVETVHLVHEVDRELSETTALRDRGGSAGLPLVTVQRQRTDQNIAGYREAAQNTREIFPELESTILTADNALVALSSARASSIGGDEAAVVTSDAIYETVAMALLDLADALPAKVIDRELSNGMRAVAALAALEHYDSNERAVVRTVFERKSLEAGDLATLAALVGGRAERLEEFTRAATDEQEQLFNTTVTGDDVTRATVMRDALLNAETEPGILTTDPDAWYVAQSNQIRRVNLVSVTLSNDLSETAAGVRSAASREAWTTAGGTLGLAALSLGAAIALAVRTSRRLRQLRAAALAVARRELPEAILAVTTGSLPELDEDGPTAAATTRKLAASNDEIGQVADAFASVHRTALELAGEQAELRVDVAQMAEVLARRIRTLITRQLRLLDDFEREETDPDALARLFALDHLAARLRRNGENLLVLAGGEPGKSYNQAFPLAAVVTAAASEIEDFARVEAAVGDMMVTSGAVADVVRILAELLENATAFSPPEAPVRVDARRTVDGAVVRVHDSGIGITSARLTEINARLAQPASLTSAAAGTMGLHVVSHLAARHGIRVQLHPTGNGTVAYLTLPHTTLVAATSVAPAVSSGRAAVGDVAARPLLASVSAPSNGQGTPSAVAQLPRAATGQAPVQMQMPTAGQSPPREPAVASQPSLIPVQRWPGGGNSDYIGAKLEAAGQQPATWFRALAETGEGGAPPALPAGGNLVWATPQTGGGPPASASGTTGRDGAAMTPTQQPQPQPQQTLQPLQPLQPRQPSAAQADERPAPEPQADPNSSGDLPSLPRRRPGALLAPEVSAAPPKPAKPAGIVDPDSVRARLSAFAEGVSAASRRSTFPSPATKDQ